MSLKRALTLTKEKWDTVELSTPSTEYVTSIYRRASRTSAAAANAARVNVTQAYSNAAPHVETARSGVVSSTTSLWRSALGLAKQWNPYGTSHVLIKATIKRIDGVNGFGRMEHTVSVVKGRAYVFGGETRPGTFAINDMNIILLSAYEGQDVDYTTVPARSRLKEGPVPGPRKGHTAVVIGDAIIVFGGEVDEQGQEHEKDGRVWIFDTNTNTWSFADPAADAPYPSSRASHAAAASELPAAKIEFSGSRPEKDYLPQQPPPAGQFVPEPPGPGTWGTLFVYGGCQMSANTATGNDSQLGLLNDAWAFDLNSSTWYPLPPPPGPARSSASLACVGDCIWRFGGFDNGSYIGGAVDQLNVSGVLHGVRNTALGQLERGSGLGDWEVRRMGVVGPVGRADAGCVDVTVLSGRQYLVFLGGQGQPFAGKGKGKARDMGTIPEDGPEGEAATTAGASTANEESNPRFMLDDIWTYQIPAQSELNSPIRAVGDDGDGGEEQRPLPPSSWAEAEYRYVGADDEVREDRQVNAAEVAALRAFRRRAGAAAAKGSEVEGSSVLVWGGLDERGRVRSDGYLVTIET